MSLKIKTGADLERLREFGFAPGEELAQTPQFGEYFEGRGYQLPWWHKFEEDPDRPGWPNCDEDGLPLVHAWVDTRDGKNLLWFDVVPCCTYHAEMSDLDLITDTVLGLTRAGLIEDGGAETEVDVIRKALADWRPELNHIIETLGTEELLAQLAEEAAELSKAALKLRRALDGKNPTPVSPSEALRNVREEMADVLLCSISVGLDEQVTERTIREKIPRWSGRIDHDPDSDCPGEDKGFHDAAGGYHEGGCGWDPNGNFCGECSDSDCGQCPAWRLIQQKGRDENA